jgi:outer membrane protein
MRFIVMGSWGGAVALLAVVAPIATPLAAQGSGAQGAAKIGYVNSRAILMETPGYAAADSALRKEAETLRTEGQKLRQSLDSAANELERQSAMLSATQRAAKRKALEEQGAKAEQRYSELQEKAAERERTLLEPIHRKINSVIEGVRAAGGYALIFDAGSPNSGIVAADTSLDLTPRVIQQLKSGS